MNYQEKVSTRAEVRALYERVVKDPSIARYRGYTDANSYGWNAQAGDYFKREGEVWFENPAFDATFVPEGTGESENAELLDEQLAEREETIKELEESLFEAEREAEELEGRLAEAEALAKAAERERDEAKEALVELRRALLLVGQLAGLK